MSTQTRSCAERSGLAHLSPWSSAAGSAPRAGRSSKASTSPRAKRASGANSRRRACTSWRSSAPAGRRSASFSSADAARISTREFLVFNQELATLLKAGMPLVQSLDILRQRVANPALQVRAGRRLRAGARGQLAVGGVRGARRRCFPASTRHRCSPARRAATSSGHPALRRLRESRRRAVRRKTISALVYPAILLVLSLIVVVDHRAAGRAGVRRVLRAVRQGAAALDPVHRRRSRTSRRTYFLLVVLGHRRRRWPRSGTG